MVCVFRFSLSHLGQWQSPLNPAMIVRRIYFDLYRLRPTPSDASCVGVHVSFFLWARVCQRTLTARPHDTATDCGFGKALRPDSRSFRFSTFGEGNLIEAGLTVVLLLLFPVTVQCVVTWFRVSRLQM